MRDGPNGKSERVHACEGHKALLLAPSCRSLRKDHGQWPLGAKGSPQLVRYLSLLQLQGTRFFFFFFFWPYLWLGEVPGSGLKLRHSNNANCCSDNAVSLTCYTSRELLGLDSDDSLNELGGGFSPRGQPRGPLDFRLVRARAETQPNPSRLLTYSSERG